MKLYTLILILQSVIVFASYSQSVSVTVEDPSESVYPDELPVARYIGADYKEMRYQFIEDWKRGEIILSSGKVIPNQLLRFNYYQNELAWLRETDFKTGILLKESIQEFSFYAEKGKPNITYKKLMLNKLFINTNLGLYVQMLAENEDTIFCYRKYNKVGQTEEYKLTNQYYLIRNGAFLRFYLRKSSILGLFENEEKQIMKKIIRSNHLRVRKEDAMIKAFELFNK